MGELTGEAYCRGGSFVSLPKLVVAASAAADGVHRRSSPRLATMAGVVHRRQAALTAHIQKRTSLTEFVS